MIWLTRTESFSLSHIYPFSSCLTLFRSIREHGRVDHATFVRFNLPAPHSLHYPSLLSRSASPIPSKCLSVLLFLSPILSHSCIYTTMKRKGQTALRRRSTWCPIEIYWRQRDMWRHRQGETPTWCVMSTLGRQRKFEMLSHERRKTVENNWNLRKWAVVVVSILLLGDRNYGSSNYRIREENDESSFFYKRNESKWRLVIVLLLENAGERGYSTHWPTEIIYFEGCDKTAEIFETIWTTSIANGRNW